MKVTSNQGAIDLLGPFGRLAQALPYEWAIPHEVELDGDRLVWRVRPQPAELPRVRVDPGSQRLLREFVELADEPPERIRNFARRWGPLYLCEEHGLPASHLPSPSMLPQASDPACHPPGDPARGEGWEPVEPWYYFARQARALVNLAQRLKAGRGGAIEDWQALPVVEGGAIPPSWDQAEPEEETINTQRFALAAWIDQWVRAANVRPGLIWRRQGAAISLIPEAFGGLFGALAVQLLTAISRTDNMTICSACGVPYDATRRPAATRRNYCPDCRKTKRNQDKVRAYRARQRRALRLAAKGETPERIAKQIGSKVDTVWKWVARHGEGSRSTSCHE